MMDDSKLDSSAAVDVYRDTAVRYLGYANEVGESFRAQIGPKWVLASYGVATVYVIADTLDKSVKTYRSCKSDANRIKKTTYMASDAFIWQMLASVFVPGFTINRVCALSNYLLLKNRNLKTYRREWIITLIGLCVIPFIIKPIDHATDRFMDSTFRKYFVSE